MNSAMCSAAGAGRVVDPAYVAGAETDERSCVLAKRCKDQLAHLTGFKNLSSVNIHCFNKDMVFGNIELCIFLGLSILPV